MAVSVIPTLDLERAIAEQGYDVIVGFDEVGRLRFGRVTCMGRLELRKEVHKNLRLWKYRKAWPTPKC